MILGYNTFNMKQFASHFVIFSCLAALGAGCYLSTGMEFRADAESDTQTETMVDGPEICVPSQEICNGEDDDCDGDIDEDGVCECTDPSLLQVLHRESLPGPGDAADPTMVWNGREYGMVWDNGFARIDRAGHAIEQRVSFHFGGSESVDIVWSEVLGLYIFCWASGVDVICGTQDPDDPDDPQRYTVVDREPHGRSYNPPRTNYNPAAGELAVLYPFGAYGSQDFFLSLTDTSWEAVGDSPQVNDTTARHIWYTAILWTGDGYAFSYLDDDELVHLQELDAAGSSMDSTVFDFGLEHIEYLGETMLRDESSYMIAASDFRDIYFYRVNMDGEILASNQVSDYDGSVLVYTPVLAAGPWTGIVWNDLEGSGWDSGPHSAWFTVLDEDGNVLRDPILLSDQAIYPWIASDGETYLVAWREGDIWEPEIAIVRIGCP